jgi:hypothetical protein
MPTPNPDPEPNTNPDVIHCENGDQYLAAIQRCKQEKRFIAAVDYGPGNDEYTISLIPKTPDTATEPSLWNAN